MKRERGAFGRRLGAPRPPLAPVLRRPRSKLLAADPCRRERLLVVAAAVVRVLSLQPGISSWHAAAPRRRELAGPEAIHQARDVRGAHALHRFGRSLRRDRPVPLLPLSPGADQRQGGRRRGARGARGGGRGRC